MKNNRLIITLPEILRVAIRNASKQSSCSQAEIIRASLYQYLKGFIEQENRQEKQKTLTEILQDFMKGLSKDG